MSRQLGKLPPRIDPRTLALADYIKPGLPAFPDTRRWDIPIKDWGVMGNDQSGNCVIATAGHLLLNWRANELGDTRRLSDAEVLELSRQMGALRGYVVLNRLNYWRKKGMWGNRLWAYASIPTADYDAFRVGVNSFGGVDIGVAMPAAWQSSEVWNTGSGRNYRAGSWGLHSVPVVAYDPQYLYVVTWGKLIPMTYDALDAYCDEAYCLINPDWFAHDATTPSGFALDALHADLRAIDGNDSQALPCPSVRL